MTPAFGGYAPLLLSSSYLHLALMSLLLLFLIISFSQQQTSTQKQSCALTPHGADSDRSAPVPLSSVSPVICPLFPKSPHSPRCPLWTNHITYLSIFFLPLSCPLQVAIHNDGPVFSPICHPTHLYPSNRLFFGWGAPRGATKQDAGGMKNKNARLSSTRHPFAHSFICKEEAIPHRRKTLLTQSTTVCPRKLFYTKARPENAQTHSCKP